MEISFHEYPSEEELLWIDDVHAWPWLPRIGETIWLRYNKERDDFAGIVRAVHWVSVGGFLNAVSIYIERQLYGNT